ncbi:cytochrome b/b6 domain-containing protein [Vibrio sp.]|uniref:cytochrome b/b6 domain-containing protein n=1 Tax=Vibrio sp. TaxID=678 RepID=UPI003D0E4B26
MMWDKVVRFTHWSVAMLFLANYAITEEGSIVHQWVGYTLIGLVLVRLIWGLIVNSPARLSAIRPSPSMAIEHLIEVFETRKDHHEGHNPAGAVMIWCMWCGLMVTGITGYLAYSEQLLDMEWMESIHEVAANVTFICVCIHVGAVALMTRLTGKAYLKSMGIGR